MKNNMSNYVIKTLSFFSIVLLAGCANYRWTKPGGTQQSFASDSYQCQLEAQRVAPYRNQLVPITNRNLSTSYMTQDGNRNAREELTKQCLQARGWQLVRVD